MPLQHDGRDGVDVLLSNQPGAERPLPVVVVALSFSFNGSGLFDSNVSTFFNMWKKIKSNPHVKTALPPCRLSIWVNGAGSAGHVNTCF